MMAKDTFLMRKLTLNCNGKLIDLSKPSIMAVLNLTSDSFYEGSRINQVSTAIEKTREFLAAGATFIDIGAYSSRSGAVHISTSEETQKLVSFISQIKDEFKDCTISVDTFRAEVAKEAVAAGADIINDISAGNLDSKMFETVASLQVPYIIMHMRGTPQNMQNLTEYQNLEQEIFCYFSNKINQLRNFGIKDIIIDPGFGFAKTLEQNYQLLQNLEILKCLDTPILVGVSRKSMIYKALDTNAMNALNGTTILNTISLIKGANILRVHDVKEALECVKLTELSGY